MYNLCSYCSSAFYKTGQSLRKDKKSPEVKTVHSSRWLMTWWLADAGSQKLNVTERKTVVFQLRPGELWKQARLALVFQPSHSSFWFHGFMPKGRGWGGLEEQQRANRILEVWGEESGRGLEKQQRFAPVCCVQLSRALQQGSVGIWGKPTPSS